MSLSAADLRGVSWRHVWQRLRESAFVSSRQEEKAEISLSGCLLPTVDRPNIPDLKCIAGHTLKSTFMMNNEWKKKFSKIVIIDCRFDYEYSGGHIKTALHCSEPKDMITNFFKHPPSMDALPVCMIFHCEFSKNRAPKM